MMSDLALQMTVLITSALVAGVITGWWAYYFMRREELVKCRYELAGLRRNYSETLEENRNLKAQIKIVESKLPKPRPVNEGSLDHGQYIELRKELEKSRQQLTRLSGQLAGRDKRIEHLTQLSKQQERKLHEYQPSQDDDSEALARTVSMNLMRTTPKHDDLKQLRGLSNDVEYKFQALGIQNFHQLAALSNGDLERYQRLLNLPLKALQQWRSTALEHLQQPHCP